MKLKQEKIPVPRDGKDSFYRKLQLDSNTMRLIRNYRSLKRLMDQDAGAMHVREVE